MGIFDEYLKDLAYSVTFLLAASTVLVQTVSKGPWCWSSSQQDRHYCGQYHKQFTIVIYDSDQL